MTIAHVTRPSFAFRRDILRAHAVSHRTLVERLGELLRRLAQTDHHEAVAEYQNVLRALADAHHDSKPPVWVLSTGRCGTLALSRFLDGAQRVLPLHRNVIGEPAQAVREAFHTVSLGAFGGPRLRQMTAYVLSRSVPELGRAIVSSHQYCMVNHSFTAWAPFIAHLLPNARFIVLRRNRIATARSLHLRTPFRGQIEPVEVMRDVFEQTPFNHVPLTLSVLDRLSRIAWYVHAVHEFIEAFRATISAERCAVIESESMFAGDRCVFDTLTTMLDLPPHEFDRFRRCMATPVNTKRDEQTDERPTQQSEALDAALQERFETLDIAEATR